MVNKKIPLIVRPAAMDDAAALLALTRDAGTGMTTVPQTEEAMAARIEASRTAFAGHGRAPAGQTFFFVLEDDEGPVGMASIFPNLGEDRPFYSYRLSHIATQAPEIDLRASTDILSLVNDFHGYAEIGTLLVGKRARGRGAGRFLSLSRFLFMAAQRERFGDRVMAEIRGWFDEDGSSPFWEHISAKFFHTTFDEADRLSANDFRFISHLMPKFPIYVSLLPEAAQDVIGKPHTTSEHAMNLLASEGFEWTRCIDIFDGGPSLECQIDKVRTVAATQRRTLTIASSSEHISGAEPFLAAPAEDGEFCVVLGEGHREGRTIVLGPEAAARVGWRAGAPVLAAPLKG
jgi:arginine N-succinyltransferase